MRLRKGSKVKAAKNITWSDILDYAAPPMTRDRTVVPAGTLGKIYTYNKELDIFLVQFDEGGEWWLNRDCIVK